MKGTAPRAPSAEDDTKAVKALVDDREDTGREFNDCGLDAQRPGSRCHTRKRCRSGVAQGGKLPHPSSGGIYRHGKAACQDLTLGSFPGAVPSGVRDRYSEIRAIEMGNNWKPVLAEFTQEQWARSFLMATVSSMSPFAPFLPVRRENPYGRAAWASAAVSFMIP